jgi:hypothetical protein
MNAREEGVFPFDMTDGRLVRPIGLIELRAFYNHLLQFVKLLVVTFGVDQVIVIVKALVEIRVGLMETLPVP